MFLNICKWIKGLGNFCSPNFLMKQILYFLLCLGPAVLGQRPWNDLRARFAVDPTQGFYELPLTTRSPLMTNYVQVNANFNLPVTVYCYPNDPRVCLMFDYSGNIAGIQISYLQQDVAGVTKYNYSSVGGFTYTDIFNTPAWGFRAYFTNPQTLTTAGRQNLNEVVEGLWVYLRGQLYEIQRQEPGKSQLSVGPFDRQNCFPRMGQHYFYNLNANVTCNELIPFYPLYDNGLVGFGIADFGQASTYQRVWYEQPPVRGVNAIITNRPACLDTWVNMYGIYSLHVYFVDHPWNITCPA